MNKGDEQREMKIAQRCAVLADIIVSIRGIYHDAEPAQQAFIETMIGAAIWYIPKPVNAWTGFISLGALQAHHPDSGIEKPKLSEEHVYPRKVAARILLADESLNHSEMNIAFNEKYGRFHYLTSAENKAVQPFQRVDVFSTPSNAYSSAGVELIKMDKGDLRNIRKRDRSRIENYIQSLGVQPDA